MSSGSGGTPDDKYVERIVDLRIEAGRLDVRLNNIKEIMATKDDLNQGLSNVREEAWKTRAEIWKLALQLVVTILAAAIGAFAIVFSGLVRVAIGS